MSTLRNLISTVRGKHRLLSTDSLITDRVIGAQIRNVRNALIKTETNSRKLWATDTIFTTIPCLEFIEVPISECCSYSDPCQVSRTKHKIPKLAEGNYQYVIQGLWSINVMGGKGRKFTYVTINRYMNLLKLPIIKKNDYFWIVNDYLYTSNSDLKAARMSALFEGDVSNEILFGDCDCGDVNKEEECTNPLDKEFGLPGYLETKCLDKVSQELLSTYFNVKTDLSQDGIDGQAKNSKPTS